MVAFGEISVVNVVAFSDISVVVVVVAFGEI